MSINKRASTIRPAMTLAFFHLQCSAWQVATTNRPLGYISRARCVLRKRVQPFKLLCWKLIEFQTTKQSFLATIRSVSYSSCSSRAEDLATIPPLAGIDAGWGVARPHDSDERRPDSHRGVCPVIIARKGCTVVCQSFCGSTATDLDDDGKFHSTTQQPVITT
eukprot:6148329-Amphidinium_carterae.1